MTTVYLEWFRNTCEYMSTWNNLFIFFDICRDSCNQRLVKPLNIDTSLTHISHSFTWGPTSSRITSINNHNYYTSNMCSQHVSPKNCLPLTCNHLQLYPFTVIRKANWAYIYSIFFWLGPTRGAHTAAIFSVTFGFLSNYVPPIPYMNIPFPKKVHGDGSKLNLQRSFTGMCSW